MIRKQVYILPGQQRALRGLARRSGKPEAALVREALTQMLEEAERRERSKAALERELAFIGQRMKLPSTGEGRTWKREDLHDRGQR